MMFLQFTFTLPGVGNVSIARPDLGAFFAALPATCLPLIVLLILRAILRHAHQTDAAFKKIVILVTVPKESSEKGESGQQEKALDQIREKIAVMENVFSSIGGLKAQRGVKAWLLGREDTVSFEIVAHQGLISFFIAAPAHLKDFIEQQVQAQYPLSQVERSPITHFSPQGVVVGAQLGFKRAHYLRQDLQG